MSGRTLGFYPLFFAGGLLVTAAGGCQQPKPHQRLNTPPQGESPHKSKHQASYKAMNDNALLADMAMYELHFMPHQSQLTRAGETRVKRYAELLKDSGGTLAYESQQEDRKLNAARLDAIRRCLAEAGVKDKKIDVKVGMGGATGTDPAQAMIARQTGTTIPKPKSAASINSTTGATGAGGGGGASAGNAPSGGGKE